MASGFGSEPLGGGSGIYGSIGGTTSLIGDALGDFSFSSQSFPEGGATQVFYSAPDRATAPLWALRIIILRSSGGYPTTYNDEDSTILIDDWFPVPDSFWIEDGTATPGETHYYSLWAMRIDGVWVCDSTEGRTEAYSYGPAVLSLSYATKRIIFEKVIDRRLGIYSPSPPDGWKWDKRYFVADKIAETLPFPGRKNSHLLGLPKEFWQNGPVAGKEGPSVKVEKIEEKIIEGRTSWVPIIHSGDVCIWKDVDYLFSDDSVVETLDLTSIDSSNRSTHTLQRILRPGSPISATIFERKLGFGFLPWRQYSRREHFTGIVDSSGEELITREGDHLYWENVDITKREFISFPREEGVFLQFNQMAVEGITSLQDPSIVEDFLLMEFLGISSGADNQKFETKYFPVSDDSDLACYIVNPSAEAWDEYSIVTTFTAANQVKLDMDLGVLTFGTTEEGSTPPPSSGLFLYLAYRATPRIEYEEDGFSEYCTAKDANINPLGQTLNRGFVVIGRTDLDATSIVLSTTKPFYQGAIDTFGPIYVGADYASLTATVYSGDGIRIPNLEVTFDILTSPSVGNLGQSGSSAERRTNHNGQAFCSYSPPTSTDEMGFFVKEVGAGNTLNVSTDSGFTELEDIYTYHVLKDDPWSGKVEADINAGEIEWTADPPNGRRVIFYKWQEDAINPITGKFGAYAPVRPSSIDSSGSSLTYSDTLATPDPSSTTDLNLGAYWVVSDRNISVRASVYSPRLGRLIFSNILNLRIEIPSYMKGDYVRDALYTIPFGWRLKDDTYEVASALNGATYICINPVAGPYPIVDVIEGETWDPYSGEGGFWPYDAYPSSGVSRPFAHFSLSWNIE